MLDFQDIGMKVTLRRKELKLSQSDVARSANVVRQTIARIEGGLGGSVASSTLLSVLNALNYDLVLEFGLRDTPLSEEPFDLEGYLDDKYFGSEDEW